MVKESIKTFWVFVGYRSMDKKKTTFIKFPEMEIIYN